MDSGKLLWYAYGQTVATANKMGGYLNIFWLSKLRKGKGEINSPFAKALLQIQLIRTNRQWLTRAPENNLERRRRRLAEARGKIFAGLSKKQEDELESPHIPILYRPIFFRDLLCLPQVMKKIIKWFNK